VTAPIAAFMAITTAGGTGLHPKGHSAAEDGEARLFCFAMQRRETK
jgi:hypothetical protein